MKAKPYTTKLWEVTSLTHSSQNVHFYHPKPCVKPSFPSNFRVIEEIGVDSNLVCESAILEADKREFLISFIRCGLPKNHDTSAALPTWGGTHAVISTATLPLMRVGFMPVIPSPVTDYATIHKALVPQLSECSSSTSPISVRHTSILWRRCISHCCW